MQTDTNIKNLRLNIANKTTNATNISENNTKYISFKFKDTKRYVADNIPITNDNAKITKGLKFIKFFICLI
jgi:hypothetical protein